MFGIFRITKAEFIKIFKKPSVYIMGMLLAATVAVSLFVFAPSPASSYSVSMPGDTVNAVYNEFYTSSRPDAKINLDANFNKANAMLTFYGNFNSKLFKTRTYLIEFLQTQTQLDKNINDGADASIINASYNALKDALNSLITEYTNTYGLDVYSYYQIYLNTPVYLTYYNESTSSPGYLNSLQSKANSDTAQLFNSYFVTNNFREKLFKLNSNYIEQTINYYIEQVNLSINTYISSVNNQAIPVYQPIMETNRQNVDFAISNYFNFVTALVESTDQLIILSSSANLKQNEEFIIKVNEIVSDNDNSAGMYAKHKKIVDSLYDQNVVTKLKSFISNIKIVEISLAEIEELQELVTTIVTPLRQQILNEIEAIKTENGTSQSSALRVELNKKFTQYKSLGLNILALNKNKITLLLASDYTTSEVLALKNFQEFNEYHIKEEIAKAEYLLETKTFNDDYANVFSYNQNSSSTGTTAFDFIFYALKFSSLIIIIFVIIMASNIMAYEYDTGTIKLLAIRPFTRGKILLGKLFAVMFFAIIFVLFSAVVALIAGYAMYPFTLQPILAVFNANSAFLISPILLILINVLSIILEVLFYAIIAISISTIFRSFSAALAITFVFLIAGLVLNIVLGSYIWYTFIPFVNTDFFRFLGGTFINNDTSLISSILNNSLLSNANFFISIGVYAVTTLLVLLTSYVFIKKRDI